MYRICIFYLYDPSLVCCKALLSNKVEVEEVEGLSVLKHYSKRLQNARPLWYTSFTCIGTLQKEVNHHRHFCHSMKCK